MIGLFSTFIMGCSVYSYVPITLEESINYHGVQIVTYQDYKVEYEFIVKRDSLYYGIANAKNPKGILLDHNNIKVVYTKYPYVYISPGLLIDIAIDAYERHGP